MIHSTKSIKHPLASAMFGALAVAVSLSMAGPAAAQSAKPVTLDFGTIFVGSTWYQYGASMSGLMKAQLPAGSSVTVRPYAGALGNVKLLQRNTKVQLATTFNTTANWGYQGTVGFKGAKTQNIRVLVGALDQYYLVTMVTAKSGITDLQQVKDKKMKLNIVSLPPGGLAHYGTGLILKAYGLDESMIKSWGGSWNKLTISAAVNAMKDGRADLWIHPVSAGHPATTELTQTSKINFLSLDSKIANSLAKVGLTPTTLPANTFKGQSAPVDVVGMSTVIVTNKFMSDDVAYALTKAIIGNIDKLKAQNKSLKPLDPRTAWKLENTGGVPLHPGAAKYYKEAGFMK
jgi:TRAP transporter TAXI family solute receptor